MKAGLKRIDALLDPDMVGSVAMALRPIAPPRDVRDTLKRRLLAQVRGGARTVLAAERPWVEMGPGVRRKDLIRNDKVWTLLFQMDAGATFASHPHEADEESLCLQGEVTIEGPGDELTLHEGDFHHALRGQRHGRLFSRTGCLVFVRHALSAS